MIRSLRLAVLALFVSLHVLAVIYTVMTIPSWQPVMPLVAHLRKVMGPFARYRTSNQEFIVEGQAQDGSWQSIDMNVYLPVIKREQTHRFHLHSSRSVFDLRAKQYRNMLSMIMAREERAGRNYTDVRLRFESWPVSEKDIEENRIEPLVYQKTFMTFP